MECQFGLLTKLVSGKVISYREMCRVESSRDSYEQNKTLLDIMLTVTDVRKLELFIDSLINTNQQHTAALILNDGGGITAL